MKSPTRTSIRHFPLLGTETLSRSWKETDVMDIRNPRTGNSAELNLDLETRMQSQRPLLQTFRACRVSSLLLSSFDLAPWLSCFLSPLWLQCGCDIRKAVPALILYNPDLSSQECIIDGKFSLFLLQFSKRKSMIDLARPCCRPLSCPGSEGRLCSSQLWQRVGP